MVPESPRQIPKQKTHRKPKSLQNLSLKNRHHRLDQLEWQALLPPIVRKERRRRKPEKRNPVPVTMAYIPLHLSAASLRNTELIFRHLPARAPGSMAESLSGTFSVISNKALSPGPLLKREWRANDCRAPGWFPLLNQ